MIEDFSEAVSRSQGLEGDVRLRQAQVGLFFRISLHDDAMTWSSPRASLQGGALSALLWQHSSAGLRMLLCALETRDELRWR